MIALIVDKSDAYIHFQMDRLLEKWRVETSDIARVESFDETRGETLFGDVPATVIELVDAASVKKAVEHLSDYDASSLQEAYSSGLIVYTKVARTSTKKLEALFQKLGAEVFIPAGKNGDSEVVKALKALKLKPSVRQFALDYVGDDHDMLLPLITSLSSLSDREVQEITEEEIYSRFPQAPGSVPPWDIEKHIFNNDPSKALDVAARVNRSSSYLVWLSLLKKKATTLYKLSVLMELEPRWTDEQYIEALDLSPRSFVFVKRTAKKYSSIVFGRVLQSILNAEAKVKGASSAPQHAVMDALIVELCIMLK